MTPANHLCLLFFLHVLLLQLEDGLTLNMMMTSNSITYNLGKNSMKQQTSISLQIKDGRGKYRVLAFARLHP